MPEFAYVSEYHGITYDRKVYSTVSGRFITILREPNMKDVIAGEWAGINWTPAPAPSLENE